MAAPGALLAYAWLGTSRSLIVSATTATSALSAAAVGPLAGRRRGALRDAVGRARARGGGGARLAGAAAARVARRLRLQAGDDRVPVRARPDDHRRPAARRCSGCPTRTATSSRASPTLLGELDAVNGCDARGRRGSIAGLVALRRLAPAVPGTLVVLALAVIAGRAVRPRRSRREPGRRPAARAPRPGRPGRRLGRRSRRPAARRARRRRAQHRGGRRRPCAGYARWLRRRPQPRAGRDGRLEPARRPLVGLRAVRRREPDRGGRHRRRPDAAHLAGRGRADPAHRRLPGAAVRATCRTRRWRRS